MNSPGNSAGGLKELAGEIVDNEGVPVNYLHVAAALEVMGITDKVIRERYGYRDSFALSKDLLRECRRASGRPYSGGDRRRPKRSLDLGLLLTCCIRGTLMLFPVMLSLLVLAFGIRSVWGDTQTGQQQVNSLALALVLSMIVAGGYARSLSHRLNEALARPVHGNLFRISYVYTIVATATAVLGSVIVLFMFDSFDDWVLLVNVTFLSFIWMAIAILFAIKRDWLFAPLYAAGVALAVVLKLVLHLDFIESEGLGIIFISFALLGYSLYNLSNLPTGRRVNISTSLGLILGRLFTGHFFFGFFYFSVLFADRLINWTNRGFFFFRPSYEVSLDIAIFSLLFGTGILEYRMTIFWKRIINCRRSGQEQVASQLTRFLLRSLAFYSIAAVMGVAISLALAFSLDAGQDDAVVLAAAPAYALLAWGAFACNLYTGFRRCAIPLLIGITALSVDLVLGLWLSENGNQDMTAAGLLAGGLVFFLAGCFLLLYIIRNYTYLKYSST